MQNIRARSRHGNWSYYERRLTADKLFDSNLFPQKNMDFSDYNYCTQS